MRDSRRVMGVTSQPSRRRLDRSSNKGEMVRQRQRSNKRVHHCSSAESRAASPQRAARRTTVATAPLPASARRQATEAPTGGTDAPVAADTTAGRHDPAETTPAPTVTPGGEITVSGEAEVANPWTPAAMQCDSYCQQRARSFFDPIAAIGDDDKVHPYLAESHHAERRLHAVDDQDPQRHLVHRRHAGQRRRRHRQPPALRATGLLLAAALADIAKVPERTADQRRRHRR